MTRSVDDLHNEWRADHFDWDSISLEAYRSITLYFSMDGTRRGISCACHLFYHEGTDEVDIWVYAPSKIIQSIVDEPLLSVFVSPLHPYVLRTCARPEYPCECVVTVGCSRYEWERLLRTLD